MNAQDFDVPHVSVYGTAVVKVVPDKMVWHLQVSTIAHDPNKAAITHDLTTANLLQFLVSQGIKQEELQTDRIELSENIVERDRTSVKEGYHAATNVAFETTDISKYKALWTGVSQIANVSVESVDFDSTERIKHRNKSRLNALAVAKQKAEAMAQALGSTIGEPLLIQEEASPNFMTFITSNSIERAVDSDGQDLNSLALGTISIQARVLVKFRLSSN